MPPTGRRSGDCFARAFPLKRRLTLDVTARVTRIGRAEPQNKVGKSWTIVGIVEPYQRSRICSHWLHGYPS
jgi:hypothetical protein